MQSTSVPLSRRLSNTEISVLWWLFHRRQNCWLTDMTTCSGGGWCEPRPLVFHTFSRTGGGAPGSDVVGGGSDDDDDDDGDTDNDIGTGAPRRGVTTDDDLSKTRNSVRRILLYCGGSVRPMRRSTGSAASRRVEKFDDGADSDVHTTVLGRSVAVVVHEQQRILSKKSNIKTTKLY